MNVLILTALILFTGLTIYQTACFLAGNQSAPLFEQRLLRYFWLFSILAIAIGSVLYYKVTKRMMQPLEELKQSLAAIQEGHYPEAIDESRTFEEIQSVIQPFNQMNKKLKRNEETRNQLLSDLSHELRTPLSNMKGYLEALNNGVIEGDSSVYQILSSETNRITELMGQIDWIKERDDVTLEFTTEEISSILHPVIESFRASFDKQDVPLIADIEEAELRLYKPGIQQVLTNLLSNALRYHKGNGPVRVSGSTQSGAYTISVSGPGEDIPSSDREKIFDRLYRVDASRSRQTGGAGLGLAISKEIVEQHGGTIWFKTSDDVHTFSFQL